MKIAFIYLRTSETPVPPFAPMFLGTVLSKAGHSVKIVDVFPSDKTDYCGEIKDFSPALIGFSVLTTNFLAVKSAISRLRKLLPTAKVVAGGIHPTVLPEDSLVELDADFVVSGEGEIALEKLVLALAQSNNADSCNIAGVFSKVGAKIISPRIRRADPVDLNSLPALDYSLVDMERYLGYPGYIRGLLMDRVMIVCCGRGCPGNCTFCNSREIYGKDVRKREVSLLKSEIEELSVRYRIKSLYFIDETLAAPADWFMDFCRMLKGLNLEWGCSTRISLLDEQMLKMMKDSGCVQVDLGVESGSDKVLKSIRKGHSVEKARDIFALCRKLKIRTMASYIVGYIDENYQDALLSLDLLKNTRPDFSIFSYITPFPGTDVYKHAVELNKIDPKWYLTKTHDMFTEVKPEFNLSAMRDEDLIDFRARYQKASFWRNYFSSVNPNNARVVLLALAVSIIRPAKFFRSLLKSVRSSSWDFLVFGMLENLIEHQRRANKYARAN